MNCPICNEGIHEEDVLTSRTTSPEEDDQRKLMFVCHKCDEGFPVTNSEEE